MRHSLSRRAAITALSMITACSLMFPMAAYAKVAVDGQDLNSGDNAVGGGTATLSDAALDMVNVVANDLYVDQDLSVNFNGGNEIEEFTVGGSAEVTVNYEGENEVEDTYAVDNANVTVNADGHNDFEEINASDNANVTVNVTGENDFEEIKATGNANVTIQGTDCQKRDTLNVGDGESTSSIKTENGNLTIDHVTVNVQSETMSIGSKSGNVVIDTSKVAGDDDNEWTEIVAGGTMDITESVIDIEGTVYSDGQMTIEHSDVKVSKPDEKYDTRPYRVYSKTGVKLIREKNGEVKEGEVDGERVWYVDTDDGDDVDLEADGKPAYYACDDDDDDKDDSRLASALPMTGDIDGTWGILATVALASAIAYTAKRCKDNTVKRS